MRVDTEHSFLEGYTLYKVGEPASGPYLSVRLPDETCPYFAAAAVRRAFKEMTQGTPANGIEATSGRVTRVEGVLSKLDGHLVELSRVVSDLYKRAAGAEAGAAAAAGKLDEVLATSSGVDAALERVADQLARVRGAKAWGRPCPAGSRRCEGRRVTLPDRVLGLLARLPGVAYDPDAATLTFSPFLVAAAAVAAAEAVVFAARLLF